MTAGPQRRRARSAATRRRVGRRSVRFNSQQSCAIPIYLPDPTRYPERLTYANRASVRSVSNGGRAPAERATDGHCNRTSSAAVAHTAAKRVHRAMSGAVYTNNWKRKRTEDKTVRVRHGTAVRAIE
ncbi:hypothetical protein EVAR_28464_1 [Eumeta japonica]|uniref:Uncharacterized protein n=1 Tax=Eumeta variegata TaxID=151549 RepID=A0A4C1V8H4_EUMVA|nr:hypothetical protein EVAR_28464_1 [Eumeta japonica]